MKTVRLSKLESSRRRELKSSAHRDLESSPRPELRSSEHEAFKRARRLGHCPASKHPQMSEPPGVAERQPRNDQCSVETSGIWGPSTFRCGDKDFVLHLSDEKFSELCEGRDHWC